MNTTHPPRPAPPRLLDDDTLKLLAAAQAAEPVPPAAAARIKHRLMQQVAEAQADHVTVQATDHGWQAFSPGVDIKVLHEAEGMMAYLLRLAPGAVMPPHRHPIDEECVVLQGTVTIGADLAVPAGGFHLARRDTLHAAITTVDGAVLYLRGASPHPADLV